MDDASISGGQLGARIGIGGIDPKWTEDLELKDTSLEMGRDLWAHCPAEP